MPTSPTDILRGTLPPPPIRSIASRHKALQFYIDAFNTRAVELVGQLRSGQIELDAWRIAMRQEIKDLHRGALIISKGGARSLVTRSDWARMGAHLRTEYRYLDRYANTIRQSAQKAVTGQGKFLSEKYMNWRGKLYGGKARAAFYRGLAEGLLDQVPGDGQTACGTNCQCTLRFEEGDEPGLLLVYWEMHPAEHCEDCERLSVEWNPKELWLPVSMSEEWVTWLPRLEVVT